MTRALKLAPRAFDPDGFVRRLVAANLTVATQGGQMVLWELVTTRRTDGPGYVAVPRHPEADAISHEFDALGTFERSTLTIYLEGLAVA
ncbi:hypothetical protein [Brevundimonas sp.]|uniref:hypothetical protein n=1 Tax=Brevundimonas sp. TaxID=1871086 RepID=UPI003515E062